MSPRYTLTAETSTSQLIEACIAGDQAAHALFVTRYGQHIQRSVQLQFYRLNQPRIPGIAEIEDITQEILIRLLSPEYNMLRSIENVTTIDVWLMRVAQRATIDQLRKLKAQRKIKDYCLQEEAHQYESCVSDDLIKEEEINYIRSILEKIDTRDRLFLKVISKNT